MANERDREFRNRVNANMLGKQIYGPVNEESGNGGGLKLDTLTPTELERVKVALAEQVTSGRSNAGQAYVQVLKYIDEKKRGTEGKGISADEIAGIGLEAIRQLTAGGYRVDKVQVESELFFNDIREAKGRDRGDNPVPAVGLSDTSP